MSRLSLVFSFLILISPLTRGTEILENRPSARALGMGNAFTTVVDSKDALFYNPAALGKIKGLHLHLLDLNVATNAMDIYNKYNDISSGGNYTSNLQKYFGQQIYLGFSDVAAISLPGFAFAVYDAANLSLILNNPAYPNLNLTLLNDLGFSMGFSFSFVPNVLEFGIVGKRVTRYGTRIPFGPSILASLSNQELADLPNNYGTGYGVDTGLMLTIPTPSKPTFSFVWQDMGTTRFIREKGTKPLPSIDNNFVFGFGMDIDAYALNIRPAIDFRHATSYSESIGKKIHMGLELDFPLIAIRGGFNQGYYTYGAGVDLKYLTVDIASYGVELGEYPGQMEDRRYMINLAIDLNLDPKLDLGKEGRPSKRYFRR